MMICKEDEDPIPSDEEDKSKQKKKDNVKVDKKYLWPHGITPPMKNVRRRRFRKTLRKKYVEAPEIEKEIKRLLRGDSDAVNVKWEVINEQDEKSKAMGVTVKEEPLAQGVAHNLHSEDNPNVDVGVYLFQKSVFIFLIAHNYYIIFPIAEHDLFGEALSDSEDEETNNNLLALDEDNSRLSCEDSSRLSDSVSLQVYTLTLNSILLNLALLIRNYFNRVIQPDETHLSQNFVKKCSLNITISSYKCLILNPKLYTNSSNHLLCRRILIFQLNPKHLIRSTTMLVKTTIRINSLLSTYPRNLLLVNNSFVYNFSNYLKTLLIETLFLKEIYGLEWSNYKLN